MSNPLETGNHCIIVVTELFDKVNAQRKLLRRPPVEDRAMASRLTLRFNVGQNTGVDFNEETIMLGAHELGRLEKMINELFGVYMENELVRLCQKPELPRKVVTESTIPPIQVSPAILAENEGIFAKLKRIFWG